MFKIKITQDRLPITKATVKELEEFEPILKGLKEKFSGQKKARY